MSNKINPAGILYNLFPQVRAELLHILFRDGKRRESYVRQLARESDLALRTVQKELARLSGIGLILSRSDGLYRYYRSNVHHPLYRALHELAVKGTTTYSFVSNRKRPRFSRKQRPRRRDPLTPYYGRRSIPVAIFER